MTEAELIAAYGGLPRVEECVCGGEIGAAPNWNAIGAAIRLHQLTLPHQAWRAGLPPTPDLPPGDLFPAEAGLSA